MANELKVSVLFRKTKFLEQQVPCAVFNANHVGERFRAEQIRIEAEAWKKDFIQRFPEFADSIQWQLMEVPLVPVCVG